MSEHTWGRPQTFVGEVLQFCLDRGCDAQRSLEFVPKEDDPGAYELRVAE